MQRMALIVILISLLSKAMGFGREIVLSYYFGTSGISDAYIISLTIPGVLWGIVGVGIVTVFIPRLNLVECEYGADRGVAFTNNFVMIAGILVTVLVVLCAYFTEPIVGLFAVGFSEETFQLAISFTKIAVWGMYFTLLVAIFSAFLQARGEFVVPSLLSFPMNVVVLCSIVAASKYGALYLAVGTVLAGLAQFLLLLPFIRNSGFRFSLNIKFRDKAVTKALILAMPVIFGTSVNQLNVVVDKAVASTVAEGGVSSLNYAFMLSSLLHSVVVTSIVTVIYPSLSRYALKRDYAGLNAVVTQSMAVVIIVFVPVSIGLMLFSEQLVNMVYGRGAFDTSSISMTSDALYYYSIGLVAVGLREILSRVFYAYEDTKTPMINSVIGVVLNISLNIVFVNILGMGVGGLALATSISAMTVMGLLAYSLKKKITNFNLEGSLTLCIKVVLGSGVITGSMCFLFVIVKKYISVNWAFSVALVLGSFLYIGFLVFAKIEELNDMNSTLRSRLFAK